MAGNFIHYLLKKYDNRVVCVDSLTYAGNMETLDPVSGYENIRFVRADISDRDTVFKIFEEEIPDIVVNYAAERHVDRSIEDPGVFLKTNILGT